MDASSAAFGSNRAASSCPVAYAIVSATSFPIRPAAPDTPTSSLNCLQEIRFLERPDQTEHVGAVVHLAGRIDDVLKGQSFDPGENLINAQMLDTCELLTADLGHPTIGVFQR